MVARSPPKTKAQGSSPWYTVKDSFLGVGYAFGRGDAGCGVLFLLLPRLSSLSGKVLLTPQPCKADTRLLLPHVMQRSPFNFIILMPSLLHYMVDVSSLTMHSFWQVNLVHSSPYPANSVVSHYWPSISPLLGS